MKFWIIVVTTLFIAAGATLWAQRSVAVAAAKLPPDIHRDPASINNIEEAGNSKLPPARAGSRFYDCNGCGKLQSVTHDQSAMTDWGLLRKKIQCEGLGVQDESAAKRRIAFVGEKGQVYVINEDGSQEKKLTDLVQTMYFGIQSSADGNKILFATFHGTHVVNADGTNLKKLPGAESFARDSAPSISPDGTKVVCASGELFSHDITVMDADGSNRKKITATENIDESAPVWSPDGTKIAFLHAELVPSDGGGKQLGPTEICVMNADGSDIRRLTENNVKDFAPVWSPDGSKIVFMSDRAKERDGVRYSNDDVCVVQADGSGFADLTQDNDGDDTFPSWSPDGTHIIFVSRRKGGPNSLYTMNADGSDVKALLEPHWGPEYSTPVYSPDGKKIIVRDGHTEIYIMNADGSDKTKLAKGTFFAWLSTK